MAMVEEISGAAGDFGVKIRIRPKYVTGQYSLDHSIAGKLSSERVDEFNLGIRKTKALYLPDDMAYPTGYILDRDALSERDAEILMKQCPPGAVDLDITEERIEIEASAVVATGWRPYRATKLDHLGFGRYPNVITNVGMERFAAEGGPTGSEIVRPSDHKKVENVAFLQCAGSGDENHPPYCFSRLLRGFFEGGSISQGEEREIQGHHFLH